MSLISHYTKILKDNSINFDILYIDKYNQDELIEAKNIYKYNINIERSENKLAKAIKYFKFRNYVKKIFKENNYDIIITWRTETIILLFDILLNQKNSKLIINIRDYFYEKIPIIKWIEKLLIDKSILTTISSEGFKEFLPVKNYLMLHSYNQSLLENVTPKEKKRKKNEPIRICFIGYVRFFDIDKKILSEFSNDERFIIQYFGEGSDVLKEFCIKNNINNVEFYGRFNVEDTKRFLEKADVINNLYGYNDIALDTAISTKYYYALHLNIPILVFEGTFMEKISKEAGVGFSVDKEIAPFADKFYKWYHEQNFESFQRNCNSEINKILKANEQFKLYFNSMINDYNSREDYYENKN